VKLPPRRATVVVQALGVISLLAGAACSRPSIESNASPSRSRAGPEGGPKILPQAVAAAFGLRVEGSTVSFCDKRGGRVLDLTTSQEASFDRACKKDEEPHAACGGLGCDVTVRTPKSGPSDIVDVNNKSFPLEGRVPIAGSGGDHIAIGAGWIDWSLGSTVHARRR
jgi:hypothetical protein